MKDESLVMKNIFNLDALAKKGVSRQDVLIWMVYLLLIVISVILYGIAKAEAFPFVLRALSAICVTVIPIGILSVLRPLVMKEDEYIRAIILQNASSAALGGLIFILTVFCYDSLKSEPGISRFAPIIAPYIVAMFTWSGIRRVMKNLETP